MSRRVLHILTKIVAAVVITASLFAPGTPLSVPTAQAQTQAQINVALDGYSRLFTLQEMSNYLNSLNPAIGKAMADQIAASVQEYNALPNATQRQAYLDALPESLRVIVGSAALQDNARLRELRQLGGAALEEARKQLNQIQPGLGDKTINNVTQSTSLQNKVNNTPPVDDIGCTLSGAASSWNTVAICVSNLVYYVMVGLGTYFAYIAGYIFSFAIFLALNSGSYALSFIATFWGHARDLANMAFLFILLYIGFKVMFQAETAGTIRMLTWVVVIALLVNFSFVLTRVVIDTGNILAVQFYNAIDTTAGASAEDKQKGFGYLSGLSNPQMKIKDLSAPIMAGIQVHTLFNTNTFKSYYESVSKQNGSAMTLLITLSLIYIAVGIILFIIAASLLFAGAKLLIRVVGLWGVIIVSPIAFVLAIFRGSKEGGAMANAFGLWLKYLLHFSLYPVVYLFVFLILTALMQQLTLGGSIVSGIFGSTQAAALGGEALSMTSVGNLIAQVVIRLGFVIVLLYGALSIADKVSGFANGAAGWFQRTVLSGAAGGFIGGLGRGTFGLAGAGVSRFQRWQGPQTINGKKETEDEFKKRVDNSLWSGMSKRTYDLRNAPVVGAGLRGGLGAITRGTSVLAGRGGLPVNFGEPVTPEDAQTIRNRVVTRNNQSAESQINATLEQAKQPNLPKQTLEQLQQKLTTLRDQNPNLKMKAGAAMGQVSKIIEDVQKAEAQKALTQKQTDEAKFGAFGAALQQIDKDYAARPAPGATSATYAMALGQLDEDRRGVQPAAGKGPQPVLNSVSQWTAQPLRQAAQSGAVAASLAGDPNMNHGEVARNTTQGGAPLEREAIKEVEQLRNEVQGLGQTVRDAVQAVKDKSTMPDRIVINTTASKPAAAAFTPAQPAKVVSVHTEVDTEKLTTEANDNGVFRATA